jgi:PAS domain S-box-containing protein
MSPDPALTTDPSLEVDEEYGASLSLRARILDTLGDAVIATNRYGRIIYWNAAAERLYGWTAEEVLGSDLLDVTAADQLPTRAAILMASILRGRDWSGEILVRDRSGRLFPVAATGSALRDHRGEPTGIVTVSRDSSRHRQAKEALQDSEERLELVRKAVSSVVWELDVDTGRVHWSETFADAFGYRPDEVGETTEWWLERVHADDRGRVEAGFRDFLSDRRRFWTDDYRFRRGDGTFADVFDRAYASPATGGERRRIAGSMVDLTERRRLMDEQRLLSQASMILDLSMDYQATLPTLARLIVNDFAEMCVVRVRAGAGQPDSVAAAHRHPRAQPALDELARITDGEIPAVRPLSVLAAGESLLIPSVPAALGSAVLPGPVRALVEELGPDSALLLPIRTRGETVGTLALARTAGVRAFDDDARRTAEELSRRIGRAVDHARLFESAQLAHRAKSDFLAVISHELRTPLTAVLGYADLLDQEITGPLNRRQKEQVGRIKASSDRLHRLIESILAYVRLESADERPQPRTVDVAQLLDRVDEIVAPRAAQEAVDYRIERDQAPHRLTTDPDHVLQVLLPLLTNALKFSRAGGRVRLRVSGCEDGVLFDVIDTGPGIPEEHRPYIFNVFWQAEPPSTRRAGGAGLGLSVARRVARLLGGDVVLAASSSEGSTFRLRLPADTAG